MRVMLSNIGCANRRGPRVPARRLLAAALVVAVLPTMAVPALGQAQTVPPDALAGRSLPPITPIAKPDYAKEIPLYPGKKLAGPDEQWETYLGGTIVRNVTVPTLIPFLPDPAKATGTAVILAPGGGFRYLGMDVVEARRLADQGVAAFILKYRTVPTERDSKAFLVNLYQFLGSAIKANQGSASAAPKASDIPVEALEDGQAAVRLVRSRAGEWGINPQRIGMYGGSAGAVTAIAVGLSGDASARPDFIAASIGPKFVGDVPAYAPPLFIAAAIDDPIFPSAGENIVSAWAKAKIPVEAHFYERGGHGLPKGTTGEKWFDAFEAWMRMRGWLAQSR